MRFDRITIDPMVATGKPCIRNLRFPVSRLLGLLAAGETKESILKAYPYLEPPDIDEALRYAAYLAEDETIGVESMRFWWTCPSRRSWQTGCERKGMTPYTQAPLHCTRPPMQKSCALPPARTA